MKPSHSIHRGLRTTPRARAFRTCARLAHATLAILVAILGVAPVTRADEPAIVLEDLRKPGTQSAKTPLRVEVNADVAAARQGQMVFRETPEARRKHDYLVQSYFDSASRSREHLAEMLEFEKAVVAEALALYGYGPDELRRFLYSDRENAIGILFVALQGALEKEARSAGEQHAVDWLRDEVRAKRVRAAEIAMEQYQLWKRDPCGYARSKPPEIFYEGPGAACGGGRFGGLLTTPNPPSYDALQEYGAKQAHALFDADKVAILELLETETARSIAAVSTAAATSGFTAIAVPVGLSLYYGTVTEGGYLFAGPLAAIVSLSVVTAIKEGVSVVEKEALPSKLAEALARAKSHTPSALELQSKEGFAESLSALADATRLDAATQKALDAWNDQNSRHFLVRGADFGAFNRKWKQMSSRGFHLSDIETFVDAQGTRRWDGLFLPGAERGHLARTESSASFAKKWRELGAQGLQLVDLETYVEGGERKWVGVWGPSRGKGYLWRDASTDGFGEKWRELSAQGYRLIDIETYEDDGERKWAGVFVGGSEPYALWRNASLASLRAKIAEWDDRQLVDIETYVENGRRRWVGVWAGRSTHAPDLTLETPAAEFADGWSKDGEQLVEYESYGDGGQRKTIAISTRR